MLGLFILRHFWFFHSGRFLLPHPLSKNGNKFKQVIDRSFLGSKFMRICRHDISARANLSEMASSAPEIPIKERAIHRRPFYRDLSHMSDGSVQRMLYFCEANELVDS